MERPNVAGWMFGKFRTHLNKNRKEDREDWDSYRGRIVGQFDGFGPDEEEYFSRAFNAKKGTESPTITTIQVVNKPKLWSIAYIHNGSRWNKASHNQQRQRRTTNSHTEQTLYSTMRLPKKTVWIGFVQNEWPCRNEGCCDYFRTASRQSGIAGVIFTVQDSGAYALDHGQQIGSSGYVYSYDGQMLYSAPPGAPAPPLG
jgi:hypothetical protein